MEAIKKVFGAYHQYEHQWKPLQRFTIEIKKKSDEKTKRKKKE